MTKGTKIFRIIICILLAITMIISAFFALVFCLYIEKEIMAEQYGIYVVGVPVTRNNKDDILGDGTVFYDSVNNVLVFGNANIESDKTIVYSAIDLNIELIGENKFICTGKESATGIYAGNYNVAHDLAIGGKGSLTIEIPNTSSRAVGIFASELAVSTNITVTAHDSENIVSGIVCGSNLLVVDNAAITVNNGASKFSAAVRVRGNAFFEEGTSLKASVNPGSPEVCKGMSVSGDLFLGKNTVLDVSIDDSATDLGECVRVSGLMEICAGANVKASAKNTYAIECFGAIEANDGATVSAVSDNNEADVFCSGAVINYGAGFNGEINAIGGVHNQD